MLLDNSPRPKPPPPRHLAQAEFQNDPPRRQLPLQQRARQRQPVMLLHADLGGRQNRVGDGQQPGLTIAMPAPTGERTMCSSQYLLLRAR